MRTLQTGSRREDANTQARAGTSNAKRAPSVSQTTAGAKHVWCGNLSDRNKTDKTEASRLFPRAVPPRRGTLPHRCSQNTTAPELARAPAAAGPPNRLSLASKPRKGAPQKRPVILTTCRYEQAGNTRGNQQREGGKGRRQEK